MLNDDFERFSINREVVYDSAFDEDSQSAKSIQDELEQAAGALFLRSCFRDQFLEVVCLALHTAAEDIPKTQTNSLSQSIDFSTEQINLPQVEEGKASLNPKDSLNENDSRQT